MIPKFQHLIELIIHLGESMMSNAFSLLNVLKLKASQSSFSDRRKDNLSAETKTFL